MTHVLIEKLASERQGHTVWFRQMTGIGPMSTPDRTEAREFATEDEARQCPALWHGLSCYEIAEG